MGATKPLDHGTGVTCVSFDRRSAAWLSIGAAHQQHGFVELSALPPFDESGRGDSQRTRAYRLAMTDARHAFLTVEVEGRKPRLDPDLSHPESLRWTGTSCAVELVATDDPRIVRQIWHVAGRVCVRVRGRLDRPPLAEITETDPPPPTGARSSLRSEGLAAIVEAPELPASVEVRIGPGQVDWRDVGGELRAEAHLASSPLFIEVRWRGGALPASAARASAATGIDPLVDRALAYVRGCTALSIAGGEAAILTDHRVLPLSWTRDAYWQALALLSSGLKEDRDLVGDHLRWLWQRCERPDGRWVRSHHADGRRKDLAFQIDQQLYPVVELADYWRATGELPSGVAWSEHVKHAWRAAVEEIDARNSLLATSENAADDPAAAPYIASSQILFWYTSRRLLELVEAGALALDALAVASVGKAVRRAFDRHIAAGPAPWAYAVDGHGRRVAYHDANDLPVALAPLWGFCHADDPGWRATMEFAFGPRNPAWAGGPLGGLGSAHTAGAWTLGDLQAWIRFRTIGDRAGTQAALERLHAVAFDDGMLPEAYDEHGGRIRHWFAWPGAVLASLLMRDATDSLESAIGPRTGWIGSR